MKKFVAFISLISVFASAGANVSTNYIGIDIIEGKNGYQNTFGAELVHDTWTSGGNIFAGHNFNNWLSFEIGYQRFANKFRTAEVVFDSEHFGIDNFSGLSDDIYNTKTSKRSVNVNLASKFHLDKNFSIVPFVGIAYVTAKLDLNLLSRDGIPATSGDKKLLNFNCKQSKLVPRLGIRAECLVTKRFGCRASYVWEKTSSIKITEERENIMPKRVLTAKLKNTSICSFGIFYNLT